MVVNAELSTHRSSDVHLIDATESMSKYRESPSLNTGRCCVRYGRTHILCSLSKNYGYVPMTCHVGPHWGCMLVTYCLAIGPAFFFFIDDLMLGMKVALMASICLTTVSFTMVACSDPGVVFQDLQVADEARGDIETGIVCAQCEVLRPLNASHCADCGTCVIELDHHCPWTGKCVGKRTLKWFYVFLTFISLHCMLIGGICLVTFATR
ncbi:unnamed protein product [Peronospora destructor]|uniref:Palmitoyltransferase n=1 Tax=Peronospora destructor TaxID=86335 RepID=A0AAV0TI60_9STRA|nr:unnamed protein product [Peronospora destructor]